MAIIHDQSRLSGGNPSCGRAQNRVIRSSVLVALIVVSTGVLAGCHTSHSALPGNRSTTSTSGSSSVASTASPSSTAVSVSSPSSTLTIPRTLPPSSTTPAANVGTCQPSDLTGTVTAAGGGAGHAGEVIILRNASSRTCEMRGYPGLGLLDTSGQPVPVTVLRAASVGFQHPNVPVTTVVLRPTSVASFWVEWVNTNGQQAGTFEITPPNDTQSLRIPNVSVELNVGAITVSAVTSGVVSSTGG